MDPKTVSVRMYQEGDSIGEITRLLRRSYQRLADLDLRYAATWQDDDITLQRLVKGTAFVVHKDGELVGTLTFEDQHQTTGCRWYDLPQVASFHQFAVDPRYQGLGIGKLLLNEAEEAARLSGAHEIALDTAERAYHLIDLYTSLGYRLVDEAQWHDTNYLSVILSKDLSSTKVSPQEPPPLLRVQAEEARAELRYLEQATVEALRQNDVTFLFALRLRMATTYFYATKYPVANLIFKQLLRDVPKESPFRDLVDQHYNKTVSIKYDAFSQGKYDPHP